MDDIKFNSHGCLKPACYTMPVANHFFENLIMLKKIIAKIADIFLGLLVTVYIVLEELVWENIAEPIYAFIHDLKILQKAEASLYKLNRHAVLVLFLALFTQVELLGIFALKLIATGKVITGTMLYAGKIPLAAFTFWLFRLTKEKLITFDWFKQGYDVVIASIDMIKTSAIYRRVTAQIKLVRAWFSKRFSRPGLLLHKLFEKLKSLKLFEKTEV
jgi:hypothetical protein